MEYEKYINRISCADYFLGIIFYGAQNHMQITLKRNNDALNPQGMTDEDLVCFYHLAKNLCNIVTSEIRNRDLIPEELEKIKHQGQA